MIFSRHHWRFAPCNADDADFAWLHCLTATYWRISRFMNVATANPVRNNLGMRSIVESFTSDVKMNMQIVSTPE